VPPAN